MMIKSKIENNYRKAITALDGRFKRCRCCVNRTLMTINGKPAWRCDVIGLDRGRRYAVAGDHICDRVKVVR